MHRDSRPAGRGPWGPGSPAGAAEMWGFAPGCVSFPQSLAQRQSDQPGPPQAPQLPAESCLSQASGKAAVGCPARDGGMKEGCPWSPRFLPQKCLLSGGRSPGGPVHMCPLALTGRAGPGAGQADELSEKAKDNVAAPLRIRKPFQILWTPGLRPRLAGLLGPLPCSRKHGFLGH